MLSGDVGKYASVGAGCAIMLSLGCAYALSAWTAAYKDHFHLSQTQLARIPELYVLGQHLQFLPGSFCDHFGVKYTIIFATIGSTSLYLILYSSFLPSYRALFPQSFHVVWFFLLGLSSGLAVAASISGNEGLFSEKHRGKVLGALMSSFCFGGVVYSFVFHQLGSDVGRYFFFLAMNMLAVGILGAIFLMPQKHHQEQILSDEAKALVAFEIEDYGDVDITGFALLQSSSFRNLFVCVMFGVGGPYLVLNNIAFLVEASGDAKLVEDTVFFVALFSFVNTITRTSIGWVSDYCLTHCGIGRPYFVSISLLLGAIGQFGFALLPPTYTSFLILFVIMATAEGGMYATFPTLVREFFGPRHYGKNYGYTSLGNACGYVMLFQPLSAAIYHHFAVPTTSSDGNLTEKCYGWNCFGWMHILCGCCAVLALKCSFALHKRRESAEFA